MKRLLIICCLLFLIGCKEKNPFKEAIRLHTQTEERVTIVRVDTVWLHEMLENDKAALIDMMIKLEGMGLDRHSPDVRQTRLLYSKVDSMSKLPGEKVVGFDVVAKIGATESEFAFDSLMRISAK